MLWYEILKDLATPWSEKLKSVKNIFGMLKFNYFHRLVDMRLYKIEYKYSKVKVLSGILTLNFCYHFYSVLINRIASWG